MNSSSWTWKTLTGGANDLHSRALVAERLAEELIPERASVVLGSAQPLNLIDLDQAEQSNIEVARRKGGGGAVWLSPGSQLWLELTIPQDDPLWHKDVGFAFAWVGELFCAAFRELGVEAEVHSGAPVWSPFSRLICFAGLGPGEVTFEGRKLVGISQRRTRFGSRFQCVIYQDLDHCALISLLGLKGTLGEELFEKLTLATTDCTKSNVLIDDLREILQGRLAVTKS